MIDYNEVTTIDDFTNTLANTNDEIIIAKISPYCTISFVAQKVIEKWQKITDEESLQILKVDVVNSRKLSNHIAEEFGIRHESPQVIWLDKNHEDIVWQGSHHEITENRLNNILNK